MAVPKRKVSKARRDKRRSSVWKLEAPALVACPKCGASNKGKFCMECGTPSAGPTICRTESARSAGPTTARRCLRSRKRNNRLE